MKRIQDICINFNSQARSFIQCGGKIWCACTFARLHHTLWVVVEGYV